jgi:predicted Zn-dependent protease
MKGENFLGSLLAAMAIPLMAMLLASCTTVVNPVSGKRERTVLSEEKEIALGRQSDEQVRGEYGVYENAALQAYVNEVGQRLAKLSHRQGLQWKFTVVDSPDINAFALPGGYIYITRGLMAYLDSEAELAGVLGHEIGHVTARHGAQQATQEQTAGIGVLAATILGSVVESRYGVSGIADIAGKVGGAVAQGVILSHSREHELQADQLGAEYLNRANYDPDVMINVIKVLKLQETFAEDQVRAGGKAPQRMPGWMSTHPSNVQRLAEIQRIADQYNGKYADAGRSRYLQAINGITFGDSRNQGIVRGRNFYHEPLGVTLHAPEGWQIQNSPAQLTIISPERNAGVLVKLSPNTHNNRNEAIRQLLQPESGRVDATTINGLPATRFTGSKQNQKLEATAITARDNDFVLMLAGQPPAQERYRGEMLRIIESFRTMNADDIRAARPYVLRTVTMPRAAAAGGFLELARDVSRGAPSLGNAEAQLRLLNQVYPAGEIAAGKTVKTIQ